MSQQDAVDEAELFLDIFAFSREDLIGQLVFGGFTLDQATRAVDGLNADFDAEAVESAENFLELFDFTCQELLDQLSFGGFTTGQATHAGSEVGLC